MSETKLAMDTVAALRKYNRWRRGSDVWHEDAGPDPRLIGEQIDAAADEIERLRGETAALRAALKDIAYSSRTKTGIKEAALRALGLIPQASQAINEGQDHA